MRGREAIERYGRRQLQARGGDPNDDGGRERLVGDEAALPVATEGVRRPLPGRREVEFVIRFSVCPRDEQLEAGVLPEPVNAARWPGCRDAQAPELGIERERGGEHAGG